jgi:glutathione reductase (NADPH)
MTEFNVDLFVIGGGSGGVRAARIAAGHGAKVMIAEEYRMGWTCVIRGCLPKKLFVLGSRVRDEIEDAAGFGWTIGQVSFNWPTIIANKDKEIAAAASRCHLPRRTSKLVGCRREPSRTHRPNLGRAAVFDAFHSAPRKAARFSQT